MKSKLAIAGLIFLSPIFTSPQEPLDCSKNLDPKTPYVELKIGCPMPATPNNVAAEAIHKAHRSPLPTVKQCQVDLTAWEQADSDWYTKEEALVAERKDIQDNHRPVELLSVEELYRRSTEASDCELILGAEGDRIRKAKKGTPQEGAALEQSDALLKQEAEMSKQSEEILAEQLSRAESVIDRHFLWAEFASTTGQ